MKTNDLAALQRNVLKHAVGKTCHSSAGKVLTSGHRKFALFFEYAIFSKLYFLIKKNLTAFF